MPPIYSKRLTRRILHGNALLDQRRNSPCEHACPAGTAIQSVHFLLAEGNTNDALATLLSRNPFPGITGRVCPHFCENACNRIKHDEAVSVRALERFAADHGEAPWPAHAPSSGKRIAIVGAGPAGLSCACQAALLGHAVTVFEASPLMGGIPRQSIPDFRLPKQVADYETARILKAGDITVHTNTALGRDVFLADLRQHFDACVIAVGLQKERRLPIPGSELTTPAVSWLKAATMDRRSLQGKRALIIGGGGVAFDCAFTALRLGASAVTIVCLESADDMRVPEEEKRQAAEEGVIIRNSYSATCITKMSGGALKLDADRVATFTFGNDGALHLQTIPSESTSFTADVIICASGLQSDITALGEGMPALTPRECIAVDPQTLATSLSGVFAAGDIAEGPSSVAAAIGSGRAAALAAHKHIMGVSPETCLNVSVNHDGMVDIQQVVPLCPAHVVEYEEMLNVDWHEHAPRAVPARQDAAPMLPFRELLPTLSEEEATAEASRCLHCGQCSSCGNCVDACPGHILEMGKDGPYVAWPDQCWHCGCCRIACPDGAISYMFPLTMMV